MAITPIETLKNWFRTNLKPTQDQFWAWLDSYRHKSEKIPLSDVDGIDSAFAQFALKNSQNNLLNTIRIYYGNDEASKELNIIKAINELPSFTVADTDQIVYSCTPIYVAAVEGQTPPVDKYFSKVGKGNFGIGGTALTVNDLEHMFSVSTTLEDISDNPQTQNENFGDIGSFLIREYVNSLVPGIYFKSPDLGYVLIRCVRNGLDESYLFVGNADTYGLNDAQAVDEDFKQFQSESPDIPTKTSNLINDGNTGTSQYVERNELQESAFDNPNLSFETATDKGTVKISNGTSAVIPIADAVNAGLMTASEKTKLGSVSANADVSINPDWNANIGKAKILNKPDKLSQFTNDSGFATSADIANKEDKGNKIHNLDNPNVIEFPSTEGVVVGVNKLIKESHTVKQIIADTNKFETIKTTGVIGGVLVNTYVIPANTILPDCMLELKIRVKKVGVAGSFQVSFGFNAGSSSTNTFLNLGNSGVAGNLQAQFERFIVVKNGKIYVFLQSGIYYTDSQAIAASIAEQTLNTAISNNLYLTFSTNNTTDIITLDALSLKMLHV